jgi:diaminopimelate epimerase
MDPIEFFKMSGSGNDFIIIDNRSGPVATDDLAGFIRGICERKLSVGADGLILVEPSETADFAWRFYNNDGSRAEMCGNGARCVARFAYLNGIAPPRLSFETDAGLIEASITGDQVRIRMTDPDHYIPDMTIGLTTGSLTAASINTGVPHTVVAVDDIETVDVAGLGREIRFHPDFAPAGTNVNFTAFRPDGVLAVRTYERGVEAETLACGTGAVASALVRAAARRQAAPVRIRTRSGGELTVLFEITGDRFENVYLQGDARVVYRGRMDAEAWTYPRGV